MLRLQAPLPDAYAKSAPDDLQRRIGAAKVRWNPLGEPESVGPDKALAAGLTGDPVAAARRYLLDNPDLYGLDAGAVAAMDTVLVQPDAILYSAHVTLK